jgi:hypothetical protein
VLFAENCEDLAGFAPRWYSDVGPVYEAWLRAMRCYELFRRSEPGSSIEGGIPYWSYYTAAARVRGLEAGCERAEAFRQGPGRAAFSLGLVRAADRRPR